MFKAFRTKALEKQIPVGDLKVFQFVDGNCVDVKAEIENSAAFLAFKVPMAFGDDVVARFIVLYTDNTDKTNIRQQVQRIVDGRSR
jgi:hypothetical protein